MSIYIKKERSYKYKGFNLVIFQGVFHPQFFFSTKYLFSFISKKNIKSLKCLELGSGSGLLSLLMARMGGQVTAVDISEAAVKNTKTNFGLNAKQFNSTVTILQSDLFQKISETIFDFIIINPPYFFAEATTEAEQTWYCGPDGEYFVKLFSSLASSIHKGTLIYIIFSESCEIERIKTIALKSGFELVLEENKVIMWEENFIFRIKQSIQ